jgi:cyclopropane-fatty-acyl-phospholipid synthase
MNSTDLAATRVPVSTSTRPAFAGLYQRLTLRALARMPFGQLQLELADGTIHRLGNRDRVHWHATAQATAALDIPEAAEIRVLRSAFFEKCVLGGDIGFAEAFIDGDWGTPNLTAVIAWFVLNVDRSPSLSGSRAKALGVNLLRAANRVGHLWRPNSRRTAVRNIREHYDLSNDFFRLWLDPSMMYSCGRWARPEISLEEAQREKNESLCRKLRLASQDHVLEIGTGWGGWSIHAAQKFGCRVTTLTLSREQYDLARQRIAAAGLADRIEVRLQDYRDLPAGDRYGKLVSIEMLEAVGHRYLGDWCRVAARALKADGLMALQYITCADARYKELRGGVDFIQKHIFPGSLILSANRLNDLLASTGGFVLHSLEDIGQDYARTLRVWREAFNLRAAAVRELGFDERFLRKWNYYLAYCEAAFALRNISVVQTVHSRPNNLSFS